MRPRAFVLAAAALGALGACQLTEVTVPPGRRVVVVQSVIDPAAPAQFVVVEYSQTGQAASSEPGQPAVPPHSPREPVRGAVVTIAHAGNDPSCRGRVDTLLERPAPGAPATPGVYWAEICPPKPGDRLSLRVETPAGELVTGSTTVPGAAERRLSAGRNIASAQWVFDRMHDTLVLELSPITGRGLQIEMRSQPNPDDLALFAITDTLSLRIPGNLVNPFAGDGGASVFRAGRGYRLAVALTDTNYHDFVRSRSDPLTGRGFINHLTGGIGVFGSLEVREYFLRVVAPLRDPVEGVYQVTGNLGGAAVELALEVYRDAVDSTAFSAFVRGQWLDGAVDTSGDGVFSPGSGGQAFSFTFTTPSLDPTDSSVIATRHRLSGVRLPGGASFPVSAAGFIPGRGSVEGTLAARQISGPGLVGPRGSSRLKASSHQ